MICYLGPYPKGYGLSGYLLEVHLLFTIILFAYLGRYAIIVRMGKNSVFVWNPLDRSLA